jgi:single-stranded-DNA-specific exonuclease
MGHARLAVELLTSDSSVRSAQIAEYLKEQNALRRKCEQNILKQAHTMIMNQGMSHPDKKSIVLSSENWHSGVIGIVASRIVDKYYRPTIMLNCSNGIAQGSARSIAGFDLLAAIEACSEHLVSFGGHKMAAGLSIETDKIELFANKLEEFAKNNIKDEDIVAKLHIDAETSLGELNMRTVESLNMLEPCGEGNPKPVLATKGVRLASKPRKVGQRDDHLQITITDNTGTIRCVGFGMGKLDKKLQENEFFNVAYEPQINNYNGSSSVQLVLTDIQFE